MRPARGSPPPGWVAVGLEAFARNRPWAPRTEPELRRRTPAGRPARRPPGSPGRPPAWPLDRLMPPAPRPVLPRAPRTPRRMARGSSAGVAAGSADASGAAASSAWTSASRIGRDDRDVDRIPADAGLELLRELVAVLDLERDAQQLFGSGGGDAPDLRRLELDALVDQRRSAAASSSAADTTLDPPPRPLAAPRPLARTSLDARPLRRTIERWNPERELSGSISAT